MMRLRILFVYALVFLLQQKVSAQVVYSIIDGQIKLYNVLGSPKPEKYQREVLYLDIKLVANRNDTSALLDRAVLIEQFNNILAVPYQDDAKALENLRLAAKYANRADSLGMKVFRLKVLRAQVYKDLAYRFLGEQAWKYKGKQVTNRRASFESYKRYANELYDQLALMDSGNAYLYRKFKETGEYSIK